jgi:ATP-dependent RNA helicase SUPV3L1/SUV3
LNLSFQEQLNSLLNCDIKSLYPLAREIKRKLYFFVGPTNSGKTYKAIQEMKNADSSIYLAPLRLLALENYEYLKEQGINSSLITGEEEIFNEDSAHICSTIEMLNFNMEVDVCVIDEVQMLEDEDRGWAWVNAILGAPAHKVIMTGSVNALSVIEKLAKYLGEELEVVKFKRKNPLQVDNTPTILRDIQDATALIAFSRNDVLRLKSKLSKYHKVSVLYGNLSPEVRREEARRFRDAQSNILIATDAIAMGLNLPIKHLLFTTDRKFDGKEKRELIPNEVIQIAGRAGRYGHHEVGHIGATSRSVLEHVNNMFHSPMHTIKPPLKVKATQSQVEELSTFLNTKNLSKILKYFSKHMRYDGPFIATNIKTMIELAIILDSKENLSLEDKYQLASAPTNTRSPLLKSAYLKYVDAVLKNRKMKFKLVTNTNGIAKTQIELLQAEDEVKKISLYLWLSFKFPELFPDAGKAELARVQLNSFCENSLKSNKYLKRSNENRSKRGVGFFKKENDKKKNSRNSRSNKTPRRGSRSSGFSRKSY